MAASPAALSSAAPTAVQIVKSLFFIPYSAGPELMQPVYKLGWTLNYEMFFYALFALFIALPLRRAVGGLLLLLLGLVGLGLMLRPSPGVVQFWTHPIILEFGLGVAIAWLRLEGYRLSGLTAAILAGLGLVLFVYAPIPMYGTPSDLARPLSWGLPAAALVAAVVLHADQGIVGVGGRIAVALGDASYSLYLLHPIVIRALRLIWDKTGLSATLSPWLFVAAVVFAAIALALVSYRWFERPLTDWLQRSRLPAEGGRSALARSSS